MLVLQKYACRLEVHSDELFYERHPVTRAWWRNRAVHSAREGPDVQAGYGREEDEQGWCVGAGSRGEEVGGYSTDCDCTGMLTFSELNEGHRVM